MNRKAFWYCAACFVSGGVLLHCGADPYDSTSVGDGVPANPAADNGGQDLTAAAALGGNGCAGGACLNPTCKPFGKPAAVASFNQTGFDARPSFIPDDVIIPTLDDVPDGPDSPADPVFGAGNWTKADLKFLASVNMHIDFFINTDNWCGPINGTSADVPDCHADLLKILKLHNPGNHTVHHIHMGSDIPPQNGFPQSCDGPSSGVTCNAEIGGVEKVIAKMSGNARPHLTRFRAPYGEPFQTQGPGLADVERVVAKYAVAVDWNIDSGDANCGSTTAPCFTGQDIANNVISAVGTGPGKGSWGIVLMHGTFPWTHDALPILFGPNGYLKNHHFRIGTVEDAICWKWGKHSWQIVGNGRLPN